MSDDSEIIFMTEVKAQPSPPRWTALCCAVFLVKKKIVWWLV